MPRCYVLAICQASSLDQTLNNWSLFNLIEEIAVKDAPTVLPIEAHAYFEYDDNELGVPFEGRLVMLPVADGQPGKGTKTFDLTSQTRRFRRRFDGVAIPSAGRYRLCVDLRRTGAKEWQRADLGFPIDVRLIPDEDIAGQLTEALPSPSGE